MVGLGLPHTTVHAQLKPDGASVVGRAPASFADIVDRVKPAVVSIYVTNGGGQPKVAQAPKGSPKGGSPRDLFPDLPDDHPLSEFFKNLPKEWRGGQGPDPAADPGAGLRLRGLPRRLRRHQQPRHRRRRQDPGQLRQGQQVRGRADRHRPAHRHRAAQDQVLRDLPVREVRGQDPARRRLGDRCRQPVRSRRHGDGRHRLGPGPRHRLGPLRLHADRRGREPRQLGRPDLQPGWRGGGRQHRHLQPVGRQRRHRLRHPGQDSR